jgi:Leucine-rich repeat (LRR) protein
MTYAVTSSSLSSFSTSSTSSSSPSSTQKFNPNNTKEKLKLYQKLIGIEGVESQVESFACTEIYLTKNTLKDKSYKKALKKTYAETLRIFKKNIGISAYFNIAANAICDLKRAVPNAAENISANKPLLTKRIFCNLFKKIKSMDGDGFLRSLFPDEDITSASKVIDYSINPDVLEKMHQWIEDKNLITMMKSVAEQNNEVSQNLDQKLLADIDRTSLEEVHARAQSFRDWISGNNNVLLNVTQLNFKKLGLTSLPSEIDKFINLQRLDLTNNRLTQLPNTLGNLENLLWLYLENNRLTQLPDSIGNLKNLHILSLSGNSLMQLPDTIGNLGNLQWLYLENNRLTQLPNTLGNLGNLQWLYLENNRLTQLPDTFGSLGNLRWLYLSKNHLTQLPDMANLSEKVRQEILKNSSRKAQVFYFLKARIYSLTTYLPKKEAVIATVALVAFAYLTYTYLSSND